ncbi:NhaC family Na+:H+ antiporter [Sedimentibacter acidaminivorans]|uniref:NhaC family Na+:H+ antiporter n=1 Tax=Sedimentibacter acidaminivorans TaxID=913099 RepID=A0ABS4GHE9_9FIRM|nr:Na+/H+ antiporter NhaC family protein [Sedimentibacter acidaminivorans]MBP1927133.1 NhaC family Na+:H+ antiporter [Sedimentibacter acidaminivorans]
MDFLLAITIFTLSLIFSVLKKIPTTIPLLIGLLCFIFTALHRGFTLKQIFKMMSTGTIKSLIVISILLLIGLITGIWRACGTIPFFVYYGTKVIIPQYFILFAFLLSCMVSFTLGTSFGTVGTIGVVLIVLAKSGNVDLNITAGAIFSGAFFGDRCAPTSSSANLIATITETNLYNNIKNMFATASVPFIFAVLIYVFLSKDNPLEIANTSLLNEIEQHFNLNPIVMIPAIIILSLAIFKVDVKISMFLSIVSGIIICIFVQNIELINVFRFMFIGYELGTAGSFSDIISGGGMTSMIGVSFIVLIASTYSGIFEGTGMLNVIQSLLEKIAYKIKLYPTMILTSILTSIFSCNQTLSIMLSHQLMNKIYKNNNSSNSEIAIDLENTVVLISELIPWNIAIAVPMATLSVGIKSIPYAVFLYLVPLFNLRRKKLKSQTTNI